MIWLTIITITLLVAKVVLATLAPSARRKADDSSFTPDAHLVAQEGQWLSLSDIHGNGAPVRVRVRSDEMTRH